MTNTSTIGPATPVEPAGPAAPKQPAGPRKAPEQVRELVGSRGTVNRPHQVAPRPFGPLRRALAVGIIRLARRVMPLFVAIAGERCWDCGASITPTAKLRSYHIVEARLWAWEEVVCDQCVRKRLTRYGGIGPKH
jgi:hypothetical protein